MSPAGMERLESTCMLLIAIGESIKGIDKITSKELLPQYPEVDWKGAMGIRDIIAHHYFELDAEVVFNVVKKRISQPFTDDLSNDERFGRERLTLIV